MDVILFGAGEVCDSFIKRLPKRFSILAIADNNESLHGKFKRELPIISPDEIHLYNPDFIILSCLRKHHSDIFFHLVKLGLDDLYLPFPYDDESEIIDQRRQESKGIIGRYIYDEVMDSKSNNGSLFYHISLGNKFEECRREFLSTPANRFLHIGSGHSLGLEIYSLLRWGGEWTAIEPFPGLGGEYPFEQHCSMIEGLMRLFNVPCHINDKILFNTDASFRLHDNNSARLNYFQDKKLEDFNEDEKYDVCYSCAVMEHVVDIHSFVAKTFELLASGGFAFHWIDLRDHRDFSRPLDFLTIGKAEWRNHYGDAGHFLHGNQLRYSDYQQIFLQCGFRIVAEDKYMKNDREHIQEVSVDFADEYASLGWEDLEVAGVLFVLEKPSHDS
ncbi:methyltransferase domain-containing protein [Aeromonas salmonicida]|uniref:methyltransferase domain-containing protein n=1 Tax=Aeromonas salmonicida TaxID=645 RepID=UPI0012D98415|nr:methyltransferase domain-containing protein [Aeromonas salmonicida]MUG27725.1 class I SAM-dependent methyltransferase [Aeromonas salmonicida]